MGILDAPVSPATSGAMRNLMGKLARGVSDANILVIGDSTGNETTEWVYLTAQWLAARFPAYTVSYHLWDTSGDAGYATAVTIQTGSGAQTLNIWNASVAGSTTGHFQGSRFTAACTGINADLVIINHMHNMGGPVNTESTIQMLRNRFLALIDDVMAVNPSAGLALTLQNPSFISGRESWQAQKADVLTALAAARGYGVIDVHSAFVAYGATAYPDLYGDTTHPNSAGQAIWKGCVTSALSRAMKIPAASQTAIPSGRQTITNPELASWAGSLPDGVSASSSPSITVAKETSNYETGTQAMLLTSSDATSGQPYVQWGGTADSLGIKGLLANRTWTAAVRIHVPATNADTVRVQLLDNNGGNYATITDVLSTCRDRYAWVYVTKTFPSNANAIYLRVSPRSSGTANVSCTVDRVYLFPGIAPVNR